MGPKISKLHVEGQFVRLYFFFQLPCVLCQKFTKLLKPLYSTHVLMIRIHSYSQTDIYDHCVENVTMFNNLGLCGASRKFCLGPYAATGISRFYFGLYYDKNLFHHGESTVNSSGRNSFTFNKTSSSSLCATNIQLSCSNVRALSLQMD